jgi:hypothetical protein
MSTEIPRGFHKVVRCKTLDDKETAVGYCVLEVLFACSPDLLINLTVNLKQRDTILTYLSLGYWLFVADPNEGFAEVKLWKPNEDVV